MNSTTRIFSFRCFNLNSNPCLNREIFHEKSRLFLNMDSNSGFLCQKLASVFHAVTLFLIPFFSYFSRLQKFVFSSKKNDKDMIILEAERADENGGDKSELHLKFKFPTFDEFSTRVQKRRGDSFNNPKLLPSTSTTPYQFVSSRKSVSAFIEVLTTFPLREINGDKNGEFSELFSGRKLVEVDDEAKGVEKRGEEVIVGLDGVGNGKNYAAENEVHSVVELFQENQDFGDESEFFSERSSDGFLSDGDFGLAVEVESETENDTSSFGENTESPKFLDEGVSEIKKLEEHEVQNADFLSDKDFKVNSDKNRGDGFLSVDDDDSEKSRRKESWASDCGDASKLESLWEHQELIEQLQNELRKVKATGLPTILEESESPKIIDDLKPWKIDNDNDKLQHEDCIGELHKNYKSYLEMMRKFDILNYQKMYAMGFLQLKDPFQPTSQHKHEQPPMLKALVSQNLWLFKHKKHGSNPIKKLINELEGDQEVVYVGQMCLSWEFLHWQYVKALDLWNSDPLGVHRYNEVAGDLQQFQVLVQRFTEDEPFQGPRVQSYVKSRCVLRNLLQVPVIREDCLKDQNSSRKKEGDEHIITSEMLVEMIEESIRIFWQFVRSDKDCTIASSSGYKKLPELQSPEELKLFIELRKILQKKERKLKDILRSESCILRKFRKKKEDDSDQALQFFAQVDVKLVSRVINMSRISSDQLIWCRNKLSKISFVNRKIFVEPAFLLFPC